MYIHIKTKQISSLFPLDPPMPETQILCKHQNFPGNKLSDDFFWILQSDCLLPKASLHQAQADQLFIIARRIKSVRGNLREM